MKKITLASSAGPTLERFRHTPIDREILAAPNGAFFARHRVRPLLSPFSVRAAIMEDAAAKPEAVRVRSLRRRLTALDRALSDTEARALDRMTSCITDAGAIRCVNLRQAAVRSDPFLRTPLGERRRRDLAALAFVRQGLSLPERSIADDLAARLNPASTAALGEPGEAWVSAVKSMAASVEVLYGQWDKRRTIELRE